MTSWVAAIIREITPARSLLGNVTNSSALVGAGGIVHIINVAGAIVMITIIISWRSNYVTLSLFRFIKLCTR